MSAVLAIETSQRTASVALRLLNGDIEEALVGPSGCGDDLMPTIDRLCRRCAVRPSSIRTVVVDLGPGGFTGLRVGVVTAKVLAETVGAALVGVQGAMVAAEDSVVLSRRGDLRRVLAVLSVKRRDSASTQAGTAWCAVLERSGPADPWSLRPPHPDGHLVDLDDLCLDRLPATVGASAMLAESRQLPEVLRQVQGTGLEWIEPTWSARACLLVGERQQRGGGVDDAAALVPIYGRRAEAVSILESRAGSRHPRVSHPCRPSDAPGPREGGA